MPDVPLRPMATNMPEAMMRVMRVMPLTGLLPTMAMALAATVVKRKAMTVTTSHATSACQKVPMTPIQKKSRTPMRATALIYTMCFIEMSRCQRTILLSSLLPPRSSRAARPTA